MTRTLKYKELRDILEKENHQIREDLTSKDFFTRMRALYIDSMPCSGKRVKHEY